MAEQSKDILSEYTKDITPEQRAELQEKVSKGFFGEESV